MNGLNSSFLSVVSQNLDYKSINFSAKVRYNHVTETDRAREGTETGADEP